MYEYDAEGQQTGALDPEAGLLTGYIYDAEGRRVEKVAVSNFGTPQATTTVEDEYLLGLNGEQVTVLNGQTGAWQWTNVYAGTKQLATYDSAGTHFALTDWLGTKRREAEVQVSGSTASATVAEECTSLPFGDNLSCNGTDPNQLHYTGKEHDTESDNDYFEARYYASGIAGRFLTPDPSGLYYADPKNPQSLNLYSYVRNNPLSFTDPTGLDCVYFNNAGDSVESVDHNSNSGECGENGGDWVNGTTYADLASYNRNTDTWNIASYGNEGGTPTVYWSQAYAPGEGGGGTDQNGNPIQCSGNCDTQNGYSSTGLEFFSDQTAVTGNWYDALHWAVGQTTQVSKFQKWIISDPDGRNWCGSGGSGTPSGGDDWSCMAHDYNYMKSGNTWPGDNLKPFSGNKQLQEINQTLCDSVTSSNIKDFFTYASFAGCH